MGWMSWIIFGALTGWIASIIMKKNAQMGCLANVIVGVIGALIGGYIFTLFGMSGVEKFNLHGLLVAVIGSCIFLWLWDKIRRK